MGRVFNLLHFVQDRTLQKEKKREKKREGGSRRKKMTEKSKKVAHKGLKVHKIGIILP